jgi:hypothetical protein
MGAVWVAEQTQPVRRKVAVKLIKAGMDTQSVLARFEAEPLLRECLTIRAKTQPDAWLTYKTKSMLGAALLGQKKYADAEPLLLSGYEGMKMHESKIPPQAVHPRQRQARPDLQPCSRDRPDPTPPQAAIRRGTSDAPQAFPDFGRGPTAGFPVPPPQFFLGMRIAESV